jgi:exosome complex component RRP4
MSGFMQIVLDDGKRVDPPSQTRAGWVLPGDLVDTPAGSMRGHGTWARESEEEVRSTVVGRVERVNKLVGVRSWRQRYVGEVGQVVVGVVAELAVRRWRLDVGAPQLAALALSSINLPGGVLRRRTDLDALQMREHFVEGDVVVCEVQAVHHDGSLALHTRSLRYGKLRGGTVVALEPALVARAASAFAEVGAGGPEHVAVIAGANGLIWCGPGLPALPEREEAGATAPSEVEAARAAALATERLAAAGARPTLRRRVAALAGLARRGGELGRPVAAARLARQLERLEARGLDPARLEAAFFDLP